MKMIIDIPDDDYEKIKDGHIPFSILEVMQNGTPIETECDKCEVGNPCLYCEHEFKDKRVEQMCKDCSHAGAYGANSMKCTLRDEVVFNFGRCNSFKSK